MDRSKHKIIRPNGLYLPARPNTRGLNPDSKSSMDDDISNEIENIEGHKLYCGRN